MKIAGQYRFRSDRRFVWNALQDPQTLAATVPGVRRLEVLGPDRFAIAAEFGVGSVKGLYEGEMALEDKKDLESCVLRGSARGTTGMIEVEARTVLADAEGGGTTLTYEADTKVAGAIAGVGQRMISAAAKKMSHDFFAAIDKTSTTPLPSAPAQQTQSPEPAATTTGQVFTRPAPEPNGMRTFVAGMVCGFVLAALGVLIGRLTAR